MIGKVKLTREQAVIMELFKTSKSKENILKDILMAEKQAYHKNNECLKSLSFEDMARALLIGYEVEETFKVGDWVIYTNKKEESFTGKIEGFESHGFIKTDIYADAKVKQWFRKNNIRHAAPEEIKVEKERRWWKSINREIGEFKKGDIGLTESGSSSRSPENITAWYEWGHLKGIYPAESFIEFGGADE